MQNKANSKTEDRKQNTEDSKIMAKATPNVFYNCRESSTNRPYFMQNKPNFRKSQMIVSIFLKITYENKHNWTLGENKPNSNPNKANLRKAKMNVNSLLARDYENKPVSRVQKNKANFKTEDRRRRAEDRSFSVKTVAVSATAKQLNIQEGGYFAVDLI